jgi:hypothetical protein
MGIKGKRTMSVILATWEAKIRRIAVQSQPGEIFPRSYLEKNQYKIGLLQWLRV